MMSSLNHYFIAEERISGNHRHAWTSRGRRGKDKVGSPFFCSYPMLALAHCASLLPCNGSVGSLGLPTGFQVHLGARCLRMPDYWVPDYLGFNEQGNWNQSVELETDEQARGQTWFNKVH